MLGTIMRIEHRRTLEQVFRKPAPTDIEWNGLEAMLREAGVAVKERPDSLVALVKNREVMVVRRPHPKPIAVQATVRDIAAFLAQSGVRP